MRLTWLLQGGFLFEAASRRIVVDAYLSDAVEVRDRLTRLAESPIPLEALRPDVWICTHDHLDHLDGPTVKMAAAIYPDCRFAGPASVRRHLRELDIDAARIIPLVRGASIEIGHDLLIRAVLACHSDPEAIGLIVECEQKRVYLSGDTLWSADLRHETQAFGDLDAALVCINGRLGNMNADEALELVQILRPKLAVPMHYGLFAENTADPEYFVNACQKSGISSLALAPGRETAL